MKLVIKKRRDSILFYILFLIITFPFLAPYYLIEHNIFARFIDFQMYLSIALMSLIFLFRIRRLSASFALIVTIYLMYLGITVFYNGAIISVIKHVVKIILLCFLIECIINGNSAIRNIFLHVVSDVSFFLFIINMFFCLKYKNGIPSITTNTDAPFYLFGNINSTIRMVLPGMCCASLLQFKKKRKISYRFLTYVIGFTYIYLSIYNTATTIIAISFLVLWFLLQKYLYIHTGKIYALLLITILILEFAIVVFTNQSVINFIANMLNKNADFSGRLYLWRNTINLIRQRFLFGYGRTSLIEILHSIGNVSGSHNYLLDLTYQRGLTGLIMFLIFIARPIKLLVKKLKVSDEIFVLVGYCSALLIMFLTEPFYEYEFNFIPIFYALNIITNKLDSTSEGNDKNDSIKAN